MSFNWANKLSGGALAADWKPMRGPELEMGFERNSKIGADRLAPMFAVSWDRCEAVRVAHKA